jgi:L-lactate permease
MNQAWPQNFDPLGNRWLTTLAALIPVCALFCLLAMPGLWYVTDKLSLSPILIGAANSAGVVMGKMLAAQSLVVACAATGRGGKEGELFAAVLKHSSGLPAQVGLIVLLYAYVFPGAIPNAHRFG